MRHLTGLVSFLLLLLAALPCAADLKMETNDATVVACGIQPGGVALFLEVAWPENDWYPRLKAKTYVVKDKDADGCLSVEPKDGVPPCSLWAAVEFGTGEQGLSTPPDYPLRLESFPVEALVEGTGGDFELVDLESEFLEAMVVRPGVGAWRLSVGDGGTSDDDANRNRHVAVRLSAMTPVKSSPAPPQTFAKGDVVVAVHARTMTVTTTVVE